MRHGSYNNSSPTPTKKLPKASVAQSSFRSILKSKLNNISFVNSQFSKLTNQKISTGPKIKPIVLFIEKLSQIIYHKIDK